MSVIAQSNQSSYVTEVADYKKPLTLPELRLGPVNFYPRLGFQSVYNDNIYVSTKNPISDLIWTFSPGIFAVAGDKDYAIDSRAAGRTVGPTRTSIITDPEYWPGKLAYIDYSAAINQYTSHSDQNNTDHRVSGYFFYPFTKSLLEFKQDYSKIYTEVLEATRRVPQTAYDTSLTFGMQTGAKSSIESTLTRSSTDYQRQYNFVSYADYRLDNWFNWQYTPKLNLAAGFAVGLYDIENQPNQTYEQFRLRARYHILERLWTDGSVGIQLRQFGTDRPSTTEPVFSISASYAPREKTILSIGLNRSEYASVYSGYNYISTSVGAGIYQRIANRYSVSLGGGYNHITYLGTFAGATINRSDDYYYASLQFTMLIAKHLDGSFFYRHSTAEYGTGATYSNNKVGIQLTWSY
ncbi:MAG: hypothetical protein ACP5TE_05390 [Verrucomicrobiia bacterium]